MGVHFENCGRGCTHLETRMGEAAVGRRADDIVSVSFSLEDAERLSGSTPQGSMGKNLPRALQDFNRSRLDVEV